MSHHTGAQFTTLPFQMIELMKKLREAKAVHVVKRHVPVFHAVFYISLFVTLHLGNKRVPATHLLDARVKGLKPKRQ